MDASFGDRLRETGRLSNIEAVGGLQSVHGQSGRGNRCGDSSGEESKTKANKIKMCHSSHARSLDLRRN